MILKVNLKQAFLRILGHSREISFTKLQQLIYIYTYTYYHIFWKTPVLSQIDVISKLSIFKGFHSHNWIHIKSEAKLSNRGQQVWSQLRSAKSWFLTWPRNKVSNTVWCLKHTFQHRLWQVIQSFMIKQVNSGSPVVQSKVEHYLK